MSKLFVVTREEYEAMIDQWFVCLIVCWIENLLLVLSILAVVVIVQPGELHCSPTYDN